jgi:hypothetical protein
MPKRRTITSTVVNATTVSILPKPAAPRYFAYTGSRSTARIRETRPPMP